MDLLLDTNVLLFGITNDHRLGKQSRALMESSQTRCFYSAISVWEVAIKHERRPADIPVDADEFLAYCQVSGAIELPLRANQTLLLPTLTRPQEAPAHNDPFDRMLLCQAKSEGMQLMTCDALLLGYADARLIDGRS